MGRPRTPHQVDAGSYDNYYTNQAGSGLPGFVGGAVQRGYGLGAILSGIARTAMPLLKSGMKSVGKDVLNVGQAVTKAALRGKDVKRVAKKGAKRSAQRWFTNLASALGPPLQAPSVRAKTVNTSTMRPKGIKRQHPARDDSLNLQSPRKQISKKRKKDIFA